MVLLPSSFSGCQRLPLSSEMFWSEDSPETRAGLLVEDGDINAYARLSRLMPIPVRYQNAEEKSWAYKGSEVYPEKIIWNKWKHFSRSQQHSSGGTISQWQR